MAAVKSLYTLALESIPPYPSPNEFASNYLPKCHALYEPLYNLYYEEERQRYRSEHEMLNKYVETNTCCFNKYITPPTFFAGTVYSSFQKENHAQFQSGYGHTENCVHIVEELRKSGLQLMEK